MMQLISPMRRLADSLDVTTAPARKRLRASRRLTDERGLTLIEMIVAMAVALVLLVPTVLLITTAQNHASGDVARSNTIAFAQTGLRQMDQELRQAYQIEYPTSTNNSLPSCPEGTTGAAAGVQTCNVLDVLARLTNTGLTTATSGDFEVRYDCSVPSTTIAGDQACWRYLCSASASSASTPNCSASSSALLSTKLVVDDLVNGTASDPVFSLCYPTSTTSSNCGTGSPRPTSGSVTLKLPSTGTQATNRGGDPSVIYLTDGIYFPDLDFGQ